MWNVDVINLSFENDQNKDRDRYPERQQTKKIETELRDVDRIRITPKVYECCLGWPSGGS